VRGAGARLIATVCPLCQFNVDSGQNEPGLAPIPVLYFTQLAGIALGLEPGELGFDKLLIPAGGIFDSHDG
jgi:heterodisulfide reductase subunit B